MFAKASGKMRAKEDNRLIITLCLILFAALLCMWWITDVAFGQSGFRPDDVRVDTSGVGTNVVNTRRLVIQEGSNITLGLDGDTVQIVGPAPGTGAAVWDSLHKHLDTLEALYSKIDTTTAKIPTATLADSALAMHNGGVDSADFGLEVRHFVSDVARDTGYFVSPATRDLRLGSWMLIGDTTGEQGLLSFDADDNDTSEAGILTYWSAWNCWRTTLRLNPGGDVQIAGMRSGGRATIDMDADTTLFVANIGGAIGETPVIGIVEGTTMRDADFVGFTVPADVTTEYIMTLPAAPPGTGASVPLVSTAGIWSWGGLSGIQGAVTDAQVPNTITIDVATRSDSTNLITHQGIKRWHVDSTVMPFVFSSAYKGTFATGDSEFVTVETIEDSLALCGRVAGQVWTGVHDFGGATSVEVPNGAAPTVDTEGEVAWETDRDQLHVYNGSLAAVVAKKTQEMSFVIATPDATFDFPFRQFANAVTITAVSAVCTGGTNVIGALQEYNGTGTAVDAAVDGDWTVTTSEYTDASFTNAALDAGDWLGWKTTSVSGSVTFFSITVEYYEQ